MPTTKHLSYAGVTLPLPTPQLEDFWLRRVHSPYTFTDFDGFNFDTPLGTGLPTPGVPVPPDLELNVLHWPCNSASRPAWFHCVVNTDRLNEIKAAVGGTALPADLVFFDGRAGKTVTARMRMLPERPFNVTCGDSSETFWLVTLTDDRFFWYYKRGALAIPTTWEGLYAAIGTLLGTTITVGSVNAAYGTPSIKWGSGCVSAPAVLDAVAAQVGQRVVVALDGSVRTVNFATAEAQSDAYFAAAPAVVSGGRIDAAGITRTAPATVRTLFADASSGVLGPDPYTVDTTLATLAPAGYGGSSGLSGYREVVFADAAYNGYNAVVLAAYAARVAADWYGWFLADADVVWPGTEPFVPTGWEDRIEWTMTMRGERPWATTSVRRGPFRSFTKGDYAAGYPSPPAGNQPVVVGVCPIYASGLVVTSDYTVSYAQIPNLTYIHASALLAPITVTLFAPSTRTGDLAWADRFVVKKVDSTGNAVTVISASGLVEFASGVLLPTQGASRALYHDASNWYTE